METILEFSSCFVLSKHILQIQGFVWTIFALIALLLYYKVYEYEPKYDNYSNSLSATIYVLYFNSDLLSESGVDVNDIIVTPDVLVIFSWIYLFLSFLWFSWSSWQLWGKLKFFAIINAYAIATF